MLSVAGRKPAAVFVDPVARALLRIGLTANAVTVIGCVGVIALTLGLIPTGHFGWALVLGAVVSCLDLFDGTMARMSGGGTRFGATLDASCDRLADGAIFAGFLWWEIAAARTGELGVSRSTVAATLLVLVTSPVISYVKARAEASGLHASGGLVERLERIVAAGIALVLLQLGVPYGLDVVMWVLAAGSVITVIQRLVRASRDAAAGGHIAAPEGAQ